MPDKQVSVDLDATTDNYLEEGDIVLARTGASVGKSYRYRREDGRLVFAGFLIRIRPNRSRVISTYLASFLTSDQFWKWVAVTSARSGQPSINSAEYGALAVPMPPDLAEQQRIADCLTSVDALIAAQARKVDALKTHKKGLMQQLFPREGETQPQLRFPEFQDDGEWLERKLEDVAPLQRGFDLPSDLIRPGMVPIVYSNGIQKYHHVGMATGPGLVTGRSGTIGKLHFIAEGEYWPHNTSLWVTDFLGNVPRFVYYLYDLIGMSRFSSGSGVPTLNRNDVHAFRFPVPESTAEQQRIADCLTSLDDLIASQTQKLDSLKTHKKGLMQQLFPSPQEDEA